MRAVLAALAIAVALGLLALAGADRGGRLLLDAGWPAAAAPVLQDPAWRGVALYEAGDFAAAAAALRRTRSPEAAYNLGNALARTGDLAGARDAYDIALKRDPDDADARANRALVEALLRTGHGRRDGPASGKANATATKERRGGETDVSDDDGPMQSSYGDGMAGQREAGSDGEAQGTSRVDRRGNARQGKGEAGASSSKGAATDSAGRAGRSGGQTIEAKSDAADPPPAEAAAAAESGQATLQWLAAIPDDPARFVRLAIAAEHRRRLDAGTAVAPEGSQW